MLVFAGLQEGDLGYLPLVFEEAGERVAVVRPRVRATVRRVVVSFIVFQLRMEQRVVVLSE